jgi:hypothetical protein
MTTFLQCIVFAGRSDLSGLPPIGGRSLRRSRLMYRATIAWLHLVQPIARVRGRFRGMSSLPQAVAPEHVNRLPWNMPSPSPRDLAMAARMFAGGTTERTFWSEAWISHTTLLTEVAAVLRATRPTQLVDVGDGWRPDRDLSLTIGRWGWLHVRMLVEEHAKGRCLLRVAARLRPSFFGLMQLSAGAVLLAGAASAAVVMALPRPSIAAVAAVAVGAMAARMARQTARTVAVFHRAIARVTIGVGMMRLAAHAASPSTSRAEATPLQEPT